MYQGVSYLCHVTHSRGFTYSHKTGTCAYEGGGEAFGMRDNEREKNTNQRTVLNGIEMVHRLHICDALRKQHMAVITPIDVIAGISGKYGSNSSDYFSTNSSSGQIHLAKYKNKPTGEPTEAQTLHRQMFGKQMRQVNAWLLANRPNAVNGDRGTAAYQKALSLKKQMRLSNVRQVVIKYMDEEGNVTLPSGSAVSGGTETDPSITHQLTLEVSPADAGTVTGGGVYTHGQAATLVATAKSGYKFSQWSDGDTSASRTLVITEDRTLTAVFTSTTTSGGGVSGGEDALE